MCERVSGYFAEEKFQFYVRREGRDGIERGGMKALKLRESESERAKRMETEETRKSQKITSGGGAYTTVCFRTNMYLYWLISFCSFSMVTIRL